MERPIFTVTAVNEYIKSTLDADPALSSIFLRGEISNFTNHRSGHYYFTLKDETSRLSAVMFRSSACRLKFMPENGMKVIVGGRISAYVRDGVYQIYAETMEPDGTGALMLAFEQLKAKLRAEGLFDEEKKKPLPALPFHVGVITSPTGAAIRDIINILGRRFPPAKVVLFPALVQGEGAAPSLVAGLSYFNREKNVDVIILGRGGGSLEDLWAFNDEALVRAVAASGIPVISAVGHEIDFTLCDFAADKRAPTPSAAAELAVPDLTELKHSLRHTEDRLALLIQSRLTQCRSEWKRLAESRVLTSPLAMLDDKRMRLDASENALSWSVERVIDQKKAAFASLAAKLEALDPLSVVARGYSAVFDEEGKVIRSVNRTAVGQTVSFMMTDGTVHATVNAIEKKESKNDEQE